MFLPMINPAVGKILDLTGAPPYLLRAGETLLKQYNLVTSLPLNILTEGGLYQLSIIGDDSISVSIGTGTSLNPNDKTYTGACQTMFQYQTGSSVSGYAGSADNISMGGSGVTLLGNYIISTMTKSKTVSMQVASKSATSTWFTHVGFSYWHDYTTPWTSLGTIMFPVAQSGTVMIKRIF